MEENKKSMAFVVVALLIGVAAGAGIGFFIWSGDDCSDDQEYNYYLYFAANDTRNGWYNACGADATDAFDKAMTDAGLEYEISSYGYIGSIDGVGDSAGWYLCEYLYDVYSKDAADASILYPTESYGALTYSNGWKSMSGFGSGDTLKLYQFESTTYFFSPYAADWSAESPVSVNTWMSSGPFAN